MIRFSDVVARYLSVSLLKDRRLLFLSFSPSSFILAFGMRWQWRVFEILASERTWMVVDMMEGKRFRFLEDNNRAVLSLLGTHETTSEA